MQNYKLDTHKYEFDNNKTKILLGWLLSEKKHACTNTFYKYNKLNNII